LVISPALARLSLIMMKVDVFAFGGGYASLPLMFDEFVKPRGPLSAERFMDGVALGQVTPGPIVITATFFGHQSAGILGSLAATTGVFFPSFALVIALAPCFERLQRFAHFSAAMRGATLSFVGLLVAVALQFFQATPWTAPRAMVATASVVALRLNVKVPWVLAANILLEKLWWDLVNSNLRV